MVKVVVKGREVSWSFKGCRVLGDDARPRSSLHLRARGLLRALFPGEVAYEEVAIPGSRSRFDFVIPRLRLAVEVQGQQHFKFSSHFHKSKAEFLRSLGRDAAKVEFCGRNGLGLAALGHDEDDDEWTRKIRLAQG